MWKSGMKPISIGLKINKRINMTEVHESYARQIQNVLGNNFVVEDIGYLECPRYLIRIYVKQKRNNLIATVIMDENVSVYDHNHEYLESLKKVGSLLNLPLQLS